MPDSYLKSTDDKIDSLNRSYWETREGEGEEILFEMLVEMNNKVTYIARHPERAKDHYNPNQDIPLIKELRRRLGFNQEQFADFIGVHRETVNRWENNKLALPKERREQIEQLLEIYEAPKDSLFISLDERTSYEKMMQEINKDK